MNAKELLEAIVIDEIDEARHEPAMVVMRSSDTGWQAAGVMIDPDGIRWNVSVYRIGS